MSEIWQLPATELAQRIARRQLSSAEVVAAHLARIDAVNPALNAVVRVLADEARAAAALADKKLADGETVGPLHGVPFTVKENIDMAGLPTTWGVPALAQAVLPVDAPVVERMRAAGAIPIARTNLPDMALRVHTDSSLHGLTRNPWHPGRTAGGSSGGEAAALASGMSPIGLGNDIGGSLRNPANACGIASIRPSCGRVPEALTEAGDVVEEACPPRYEDAVSCWTRLIMGDFGSVLPMLSPMMGADATTFLNNFNADVPPLGDVAAWSQLMAERDGIARAWSTFMAGTPLLLSPTWTQLPFEHGFDSATPAGAAATKALMRPVVPANLLGLPSACVPAGRDEETGLPIGVLITGQRLREDLCLEAAEAIEARLGFATPIDPVR